MSLSEKQATFVREYLVDLNATQAAIRSGYSERTAKQQGARLLTNDDVAAAVAKAQAERAERTGVKADDVIRELVRIGMCDIGQAFDEAGQFKSLREMPEDVRRAIAGIETDELWAPKAGEDGREQTGWTKKVKFWPKVSALELLGKHLAMWVDKQDVNVSGQVNVTVRTYSEDE